MAKTSAAAGSSKAPLPGHSSSAFHNITGSEDGAGTRTSTRKRRKQRPLLVPPRPVSGDGEHLQRVYLGSYRATTPRGSIDFRTPNSSPGHSPKPSVSRLHLERFLPPTDGDLDTYGVEELRDGFFDSCFLRPIEFDPAELHRRASKSLPLALQSHHPLSIRWFFPRQIEAFVGVLHEVLTTRSGIKLLKSFLGFFICYIICLIPISRDWLGQNSYIIVVSALINHPGRPVGSQVDGLLMTTIGTVAGLGWGSLALYVSTATATAQKGYGGILALFMVLFTATIGWLRCVYLRFYQAVICAGFAIFYMCLADTGERVGWQKVFDYGVPWILGQAACLIVALIVFPDVGSRSLALRIHRSIESIQKGLDLPRKNSSSLKRDLSFQFVLLSTGVRDFTIEFTASRYRPDDIRELRNLLQATIRSIMSIRPNRTLFDPDAHVSDQIDDITDANIEIPVKESEANAPDLVRQKLTEPTRALITAMKQAVGAADSIIMEIGGQSKSNTPLEPAIRALESAKKAFDEADESLLSDPCLPSTYAKQPIIVDMLLFVHPVRQTADKVDTLCKRVLQMAAAGNSWRITPPSYPWHKAVMRTNAQVRHDRGGLTAGFYFQSKKQLEKIIKELQSTTYAPPTRPGAEQAADMDMSIIGRYEQERAMASSANPSRSRKTKVRYRIWKAVHRLQGFESRFALKVTIVTTLLSVPAWVDSSRYWWSANESWWVVVIIWSQMHPRVGGNVQDLVIRTGCAALGAVWAGLAFAAGNGSPYVIAVFAAIFMLPMLYRFGQSNHPRSGLVGCLSFSVVSLIAYADDHHTPASKIAWTRGLPFVVGVAAALVINWFFWPFVARHELRKSISTMILHSAILYRSVISNYVYYKQDEPPGPQEVVNSEMLEGRLREVFVRIRQLLEMTRHELRLRAPFDPLPYSALISSCEAFFENLVRVRQSSLYFQPTLLPSTATAPTAALTTARRDAVAAVLMNLYTLAISLRTGQPVPKYLPSAAMARERLLDRMAIVEAEVGARRRAAEAEREVDGSEDGDGEEGDLVESNRGKRRWADVYEYAYSGALTDIVGELQMLKRFTREICGEVGWE